MFHRSRHHYQITLALVLLGLAQGCHTFRGQEPEPDGPPSARTDNVPYCAAVPSEKDKTTLPTYVIEPPDILQIDVIKMVPKSPYRYEPYDVLMILAFNTLENEPVNGQFSLDPSGFVDLGPNYGKVSILGMTNEEAEQAITRQLMLTLRDPQVSVSLVTPSAQAQVAGEHLVGPDGTVSLGVYGRVFVAGMTMAEATTAIEDQLKKFLETPRISIDVLAFNSKVYYVITEGAGLGDQVAKIPITGNETVLDAIGQINGLTRFASKNIWIVRPAPGGVGCDQVLPVNWNEITKGASTATNYQILPGDRVFIAENKMIAFENALNRLVGPFERIFAFSLLGSQTIQTFNRFPLGTSGGSL